MHTLHHQCIKTETWYLAGNRLVRDYCCIGHLLVRVLLKVSRAPASWWIDVCVPAVALQAAKIQVLMPRRLSDFSCNFDQIVFKRLQRLKLTYFNVNASVLFIVQMVVYMGNESSSIGTNIVMVCGLHNEDFEKSTQVFYEDNNFPVVTLNDLNWCVVSDECEKSIVNTC